MDLLSQPDGLFHNHVLVSLEDHKDESYCELFAQFPALMCMMFRASGSINRLHEIQSNR